MLIAQLTDLHIGTGDDIGAEDNYNRLLSVFERLGRLRVKVDAIVATGDLTETGSVPAYKLLKKMFDRAGLDVLPCMGNHDVAAHFRQVFGSAHFAGDHCQYARDIGEVRLVVTDTHDETIHGGDFCAARAEWLDRTLTEAAGRPVLLALHHPPLVSGIDWMGARSYDEPWVRMIEQVISRHDNVRKIIAGHIHRPMERPFAGTSCVVSSATAAEVDLELAPITASTADGRPLIIDEPPGFALHWWDGQEFLTHHGVAGDFEIILQYHERFRDVMRDVFHVPD
jgi:3',5'-cyclic AMP phosphodiesterase CpdA